MANFNGNTGWFQELLDSVESNAEPYPVWLQEILDGAATRADPAETATAMLPQETETEFAVRTLYEAYPSIFNDLPLTPMDAPQPYQEMEFMTNDVYDTQSAKEVTSASHTVEFPQASINTTGEAQTSTDITIPKQPMETHPKKAVDSLLSGGETSTTGYDASRAHQSGGEA